jgi:hypothetical protein
VEVITIKPPKKKEKKKKFLFLFAFTRRYTVVVKSFIEITSDNNFGRHYNDPEELISLMTFLVYQSRDSPALQQPHSSHS